MSWFDDFCLCTLNPAASGIVIGIVITIVIGGLMAFFMKKKFDNSVLLGSRFPGWAMVTGASCGLGKRVCSCIIQLLSG